MLNFKQRITPRMLPGIVLVILCQNLSAAVFPIETKRQLNGLKIIDQVATIEVGSAVVMTLNNLDQRNASCRITFDPSVEQRKTSKRMVEAGSTATIHYSPGRRVNRLKIDIVCNPV